MQRDQTYEKSIYKSQVDKLEATRDRQRRTFIDLLSISHQFKTLHEQFISLKQWSIKIVVAENTKNAQMFNGDQG